jgi:hypothetical protein
MTIHRELPGSPFFMPVKSRLIPTLSLAYLFINSITGHLSTPQFIKFYCLPKLVRQFGEWVRLPPDLF